MNWLARAWARIVNSQARSDVRKKKSEARASHRLQLRATLLEARARQKPYRCHKCFAGWDTAGARAAHVFTCRPARRIRLALAYVGRRVAHVRRNKQRAAAAQASREARAA